MVLGPGESGICFGMLRRIRVSSKEELIERMSRYIDDINGISTVFKWKYKVDKMAGGIFVDRDGGVLIF